MELIHRLAEWVWGPPLIILLVGVGAYLSLILKGLPLLKLPYALYLAFIRRKDPGSPGDITHFQALMTALSATVGVGNIAGVATAIAIGGPGALVWMWLTGLVGMASKYAEAVLAVKYRVVNPNGEMSGGPMYYIERGMGLKWLAIVFAVCASVAAFGIGNMVQSNSVAMGLKAGFGVPLPVSGIFMAAVTALVLLGGIRAIAKVASLLVPVMVLFYMLGGLLVLAIQWDLVMDALKTIVKSAFHPPAAVGGFSGATLAQCVRVGVARGIFSNESGLGSSPIAAAAAQTDNPVRQGLVSMTQTFLDTLVVCSVTGLVIVVTQAWQTNATGSALTLQAFQHTLGKTIGGLIVPLSLVLFAYSTILGWSYYGEKAVEYLLGSKAIRPYRWLFCGAVMVGAMFELDMVWTLADIMNGLMALPNLIALVALSSVVVNETHRFRQSRLSL